MADDGLEEVLRALQRIVERETPPDPEIVWPLMASGTIAVLKAVQGLSGKLDGQTKRIAKIDRRALVIGVIAGLALAAVAVHTGWTWLIAAAAP